MHRRLFAALLLVVLPPAAAFAQTQDAALRLAAACAPRAGLGSGPDSALRINPIRMAELLGAEWVDVCQVEIP